MAQSRAKTCSSAHTRLTKYGWFIYASRNSSDEHLIIYYRTWFIFFSIFHPPCQMAHIALNLAHTVTTVHSLVASSSPGALLQSQNTSVNTTAILTHHDCCGSAFCAVLRRRTLLCELLRQAVDRCPTAPFEPPAAVRRCWGACSPCS